MRKSVTSLFIICLTGAVALLLAPAVVSAHGNITSNLSDQRFETAPDRAEFTSTEPVDLTTAKARLRYLGDVNASTDVYFATDVPTLELVLVDAGDTATFAFDLPELGAGTYALDWQVEPIGDHRTEATQLFVVTVGSSDPDPVPTMLAGQLPALPDGTGDASSIDSGTSSGVYILIVLAAALSICGVIVLRRIRR